MQEFASLFENQPKTVVSAFLTQFADCVEWNAQSSVQPDVDPVVLEWFNTVRKTPAEADQSPHNPPNKSNYG